MVMTEKEREIAHNEWLELYTWIQEDGACDFHHPRCRPKGFPIDPREAFDAA
jgi:hypothetical protein